VGFVEKRLKKVITCKRFGLLGNTMVKTMNMEILPSFFGIMRSPSMMKISMCVRNVFSNILKDFQIGCLRGGGRKMSLIRIPENLVEELASQLDQWQSVISPTDPDLEDWIFRFVEDPWFFVVEEENGETRNTEGY